MAAMNPIQSTWSSELANFLEIETHTDLLKELAEIVADYVANTNFFGAAEWKRHLGVNIGEEIALSKNFYTWWLSPDAFDKEKLNCETHLPPVLRPQWVKASPYNLDMLQILAKNPTDKSKSIIIAIHQDASIEYGKAAASPSCWNALRKDLLARNITRTHCAKAFSALDLATTIFATYLQTGDRYLGDASGKEGRKTLSFCKELCQPMMDYYPLLVGNFASTSLVVGICHMGDKSEDFGIASVQQF